MYLLLVAHTPCKSDSLLPLHLETLDRPRFQMSQGKSYRWHQRCPSVRCIVKERIYLIITGLLFVCVCVYVCKCMHVSVLLYVRGVCMFIRVCDKSVCTEFVWINCMCTYLCGDMSVSVSVCMFVPVTSSTSHTTTEEINQR